MNYYNHIKDYSERRKAILSDPENRTEWRQVIDQALAEHGEDWLVAALIEGSIGYYQPTTAMNNVVIPYKKGEETCYSERAFACFAADLLWMLWSDVDMFNRKDPETQRQKLLYVKWARRHSEEAQGSLSMLYPTMNYKFEE